LITIEKWTLKTEMDLFQNRYEIEKKEVEILPFVQSQESSKYFFTRSTPTSYAIKMAIHRFDALKLHF